VPPDDRPAVRWSTDVPDPHAWHALFGTTGWNEVYRAGPDELASALTASAAIVTAWEGTALVAGGRLIADGVLYGLLVDIVVLPERRRGGLGSGVVERLLLAADERGLRDVLLLAAAGTAPFYQRLGFAPRPGDAPGMVRRTTP